MTTHDPASDPRETDSARCPFPHHSLQKTRLGVSGPQEALSRDAAGTWHVHDFAGARAVLRSEAVKQAGFASELVSQTPGLTKQPVLFADGEEHHEMRRQTARYFTPTIVATYRGMMERFADDLVGELVQKGRLDLDQLSLKMAVQVAAQVVGLTDSLLPGMAGRIEAFVSGDPGNWLMQARVLSFLTLDVQPAIRARRKAPRDDLISHLIARDYNDIEILTECLTYGTAGMATTREFITVAAWHLLEHPELRQRYLHSTQAERHAILLEILRLEPVVAVLYRRSTEALKVAGQTIPAGERLAVHVYDANSDEAVVGEDPFELCPGRPLPRGVQGQVMSFGDGHHRCPGAYIAIQESDILLRRLLWLRDLRLEALPRVSRNPLIEGYELRGLTLAVDPPR